MALPRERVVTRQRLDTLARERTRAERTRSERAEHALQEAEAERDDLNSEVGHLRGVAGRTRALEDELRRVRGDLEAVVALESIQRERDLAARRREHSDTRRRLRLVSDEARALRRCLTHTAL